MGEDDERKLSAHKPKPYLADKAETDLDNDFFQKNIQKVKLNKGEKRALKHALKNGENLNQIDDLKTYL